MEVILGIDGGGSQTTIALGDLEGNFMGMEKEDGLNYQAIGIDEFAKRFEAILSKVMVDYTLERGNIKLISMALAGINTPTDIQKIEEVIKKIYPQGILKLYNDSLAALMAGVGKLEGIVLIAGTGSIAYGIKKDGKSLRAGGWGHIISDEGSGFDIGRRALSGAVKSNENREEQTILFEEILQFLGLKNIGELMVSIYQNENTKKDIASLATVVADAAKKGDSVAIKILEDAAIDLVSLAQSVHTRLFGNQPDIKVVLAGSILKKNEIVQKKVIERLNANKVKCVILDREPVIGAMMIGYEHLGMSPDKLVYP